MPVTIPNIPLSPSLTKCCPYVFSKSQNMPAEAEHGSMLSITEIPVLCVIGMHFLMSLIHLAIIFKKECKWDFNFVFSVLPTPSTK